MSFSMSYDSNTYPNRANTEVVVSDLSEDVNLGNIAVPLKGNDQQGNYKSGALIMSTGGRTIKVSIKLEILTDDIPAEYASLRNFFSGFSVGDKLIVNYPDLGWNNEEFVVEKYSIKFKSGTTSYLYVMLNLLYGTVM